MRRLPSLILAITLAATWSFSQVRPDSWENVMALQPGHKIRITETGLKSWDGNLISVSDETITLREKRKGQQVTIDRAKVFRVSDLQRSNPGGNALIGFALGAAIGYAVTDASEDYDRDIGVALLFAAPGAAVGVLFPGPRPTVYRGNPPLPTRDDNSGGSHPHQ